ncbi:MAG: DUF3536 domain-containing protein [Thermodesulfobacteriota bacterium]
MAGAICIHGHFYQPPRENPWLEEVELQESAHPYHDWNDRITDECYAPNTAARILDGKRRIIDLVNTYAHISFNFGATLLSWMQRHRPEVYEAILEADALSQRTFNGHGAALAQVYNHMIMPLANKQDKYTQVYWGLRDFERRFQRAPEGMWLPEAAADTDSLEVLAEAGIRFTVLAPAQAQKVRRTGAAAWQDVEGGQVDPKFPYVCHLPSGRSLVVFFYDGPISQDVAFGGLLHNGEEFAHRLLGAFDDQGEEGQLVHIATDGETYGHHHRLGDMALAYCLHYIREHTTSEVTIYGAHLAQHPPRREAVIKEKSSWSCMHGVERWRADCGCNSGLNPRWQQQWRKPLRQGLDWLRDSIRPLYTQEASHIFVDPWQARDAYIERLFAQDSEATAAFLEQQAGRILEHNERIKALKLLEMQRYAMLMYSSCGWFFDEISGIETTQILMYADRVLQLAAETLGVDLEKGFLEYLAKAPSNVTAYGNGAEVFRQRVTPAKLDLLRVGAHYAISSLFESDLERIRIYCYTVQCDNFDRQEAGALKLGTGKAQVVSDITGESAYFGFAALHLGDHNVIAGVRQARSNGALEAMRRDIQDAFSRSDVPEMVRRMDAHFPDRYTLWHLFKDPQKNILEEIMRGTVEDVGVTFRQIVENNFTLMNFLRDMPRPLPKSLAVPAEYVLNEDLRRTLEQDLPDVETLERLVLQMRRWEIPLDSQDLRYRASWRVGGLFERLRQEPHNTALLSHIEQLIHILGELDLLVDLWKAQNVYFSLTQTVLDPMRTKARNGEDAAGTWVSVFERLGGLLGVSPT